MSKVFERLISYRLTAGFIQDDLFPKCQFAYRSGRGLCDVQLILDQMLQDSLNQGAEARLVQLDFSTTFDHVNHSTLLYKVQAAGVGVLENFLLDRSHMVCVDGSV